MLELLSKGLNNREMGQVLGIAEDTVKTHLKGLFRKLNVSNRAEAVHEAMQRGFIHE
jgi:DNA-binding CsgD family transcriptional regulator